MDTKRWFGVVAATLLMGVLIGFGVGRGTAPEPEPARQFTVGHFGGFEVPCLYRYDVVNGQTWIVAPFHERKGCWEEVPEPNGLPPNED